MNERSSKILINKLLFLFFPLFLLSLEIARANENSFPTIDLALEEVAGPVKNIEMTTTEANSDNISKVTSKFNNEGMLIYQKFEQINGKENLYYEDKITHLDQSSMTIKTLEFGNPEIRIKKVKMENFRNLESQTSKRTISFKESNRVNTQEYEYVLNHNTNVLKAKMRQFVDGNIISERSSTIAISKFGSKSFSSSSNKIHFTSTNWSHTESRINTTIEFDSSGNWIKRNVVIESTFKGKTNKGEITQERQIVYF